MPIRLIAGLGNPGPEYEQTRHNAGFWLVDQLKPGGLTREKAFNAMVGKVRIGGHDVLLVQPQTFMNRSGQSVGGIARFYKIAPEDILVAFDELDLEPGDARLKKGGSSTHNGIRDITSALGTPDYWRLRIGIGHPRTMGLNQGVADFVLHRPRREEQTLIEESIERSLAVLPAVIDGRMPEAMKTLHTK